MDFVSIRPKAVYQSARRINEDISEATARTLPYGIGQETGTDFPRSGSESGFFPQSGDS
jgi:hypothetical protein